MTNDEELGLDALFQTYRAACPDVDASVGFMPGLWQKIEARHSFWSVFQGMARAAMAGCAALALLLLALNFMGSQPLTSPSYADALVAEHSAEKTYYAESVARHAATPDVIDDSRY